MQPLLEPWRPRKKGTRLVDRDVQYFRNRLAPMANRQDFRLETLALATLTRRIHVFKKVHFQFFNAGSFTALASAALGVEGKMAGRKSLPKGVTFSCKQPSDFVKGFEIRDRIGSRCSPDGLLIDQTDALQM